MVEISSRIVVAPEPGGPEKLVVKTVQLAPPAPGEVLIDVAAAGVNRPDVFERMGFYPAPEGAPEGLGLEVSGTVRALGEGVTEFAIGDPVVALVSGGGYADVARAKAGSVLPAPDGVSLVDAAGLPETVFTVWTNVFDAGALKPGERFLVHGGASGIGTTAIQMAKAHGAYVIATAGGPDRAQLCRDLGADRAFDYHAEDWSAAISAEGGADVILDMVGGDYVQKNLNCLNRLGRIVMIAFLKGSRVEVDLMGLMLKRQTLTGSTLRARPDAEKAAIAQAVQTHVWPWVEAGKVRPRVDSTFALDEVSKAHARMDAGGHAGKILLVP
ncbi:NAD(P)H-quinone oxidoreductase [Oceanicaulis alexandrii]|uniref:NAD(P)H-quinone oxidoreductase n=1 Tax=Oceanicaulis alexandrii TaxID=153233 RepID=UPI0023543C49|nr:NAD(P)H-quinone oxidoreductase [Oceanicaulis alexandrii]